MTSYPIGATARHALAEGVQRARTESDARRLAGAGVQFATSSHPDVCDDLDALEERFGSAIRDGVATRVNYGRGWQVAVRFWRPAPAIPIAQSARKALKAPLGWAVELADAERIARSTGCVRVTETLRLFRRRMAALRAAGDALDDGRAEIVRESEHWALRLTYWRVPRRSEPNDAARAVVASGLAAPLRTTRPQTIEPFGLFAWEPHVLIVGPDDPTHGTITILAHQPEEGDGRRMQDDRSVAS